LFQDSENSVNCLVTIAQQLGLNKLNSSTYLMAINDLYNKKFEYEIEKIESIGEINNMNQNLLKLNLIHESLIRFPYSSYFLTSYEILYLYYFIEILSKLKQIFPRKRMN
jgi:hypothetical protein